MSAQAKSFVLRTSVVAVRAALIMLAAEAAAPAAEPVDPAVAALVNPTSSVEVGVGTQSQSSFKANEYTGISNKGAFFIGNIDLRGGGAYGSDDASRWRFSASDLGTEARALGFEYWQPGQLKIQFGYDELRRNRSDSYHTPLLGAGGNVLTLPSTWLVPLVPQVSSSAANARGLSPLVTASNALINGVSTPPTPAQLTTAGNIQAADLPAFQSVDLYTKRTRYDLAMSFDADRQWQFSAALRHEEKVGMKPMGTITRASGGDISTIIPDLINQATDDITLGFRFRTEGLSLQGGYTGSMFTNNVPSMTWSNWALPANAQTMSTAPGNQVHQLNLTAALDFAANTRLVMTGAYTRNAQNDAFLTAGYTPIVPVASAQGLVVTQALSARLTSRPAKGLSVNAALKFDGRDNRTPVDIFGFYDAGEAKSGTSVFSAYFPGQSLGSNLNINENRPFSRRLKQANLDVDYQVAPGEDVKAGLEEQRIERYCNGTWIACSNASSSKEDTLRLDWRATEWETVRGRLGLAHSVRKVDYNEDAWLALVPAANWSPTGAPGGSTAYGTMTQLGVTGYGPVSGLNPLPTPGSAAAFFFANNNAVSNALYGNQNRISELPGMRRFFLADRTRDKLRSSIEWQASEGLSLQAGLDLNHDDYSHSVYGLQDARGLAFNVDANWTIGLNTSLTAFATHEAQHARSAGDSYTANSTATNVNGATAISGGCFATIALRNASNKVDPCLNWFADMRDRVDTLGLGLRHTGLLGGKLDVDGSLAVSRARSTNDVTGGNYANNPLAVNGAPQGTTAAYYIGATPLPDVVTNTVDLKLAAKYALDKASAVRVGYRFQHMSSTDWSYDGLQYGGLAGVLPTLDTAPAYRLHTLQLSYLISFQ